jgi:hypothetical protein
VGNHYSGTYPAAVHRYGLWEGPRLAGVAVLGVPTSAATLTNLFPELAPSLRVGVVSTHQYCCSRIRQVGRWGLGWVHQLGWLDR